MVAVAIPIYAAGLKAVRLDRYLYTLSRIGCILVYVLIRPDTYDEDLLTIWWPLYLRMEICSSSCSCVHIYRFDLIKIWIPDTPQVHIPIYYDLKLLE